MESTTINYKRHPCSVKGDRGVLTRDDFDGGPVSMDEIEAGLYLGNVSAASHMETLRKYKISHILTLDSVPLPQHIVSTTTTKYIHIADMPKEDLLHHFNDCVSFITDALSRDKNILVHCYFGVSRSSSAVIAYMMKQHDLDYQQAYELVKSKRRFVQPNAGFVTQLKLYRRMGCRIDPQYQKYKIYCLRLAGDQLKRAKILPQNFNNLIKPDPGVTQENPEPIVYRCRKCRRVLASKSHVLSHQKSFSSGQQHLPNGSSGNTAPNIRRPRLLEQISADIKMASSSSSIMGKETYKHTDDFELPEQKVVECNDMVFVEPIAWMKNIVHNTQGRLNCPKCDQKLGSFSWTNGCPCPCGEVVMPAFYFINSKVDLSTTIQNVQTTV